MLADITEIIGLLQFDRGLRCEQKIPLGLKIRLAEGGSANAKARAEGFRADQALGAYSG